MDLARKREREVLHFCPGCSTWQKAEKFQAKKVMQGTYGHCDECLTLCPKAAPESRVPFLAVAD